LRLLQGVNGELDSLSPDAFEATTRKYVPPFIRDIENLLLSTASAHGLLSEIPQAFSAQRLSGFWATSYEFHSRGEKAHHADISEIKPTSDRRVIVSNSEGVARTEGHKKSFRNEIDAELANRHLIGQWRNLSDTRYFGSIQLAIQTGEESMDGFYTALQSDVAVACGSWKWSRIEDDPRLKSGLSKIMLRQPREIFELLSRRRSAEGAIPLSEIMEGK
jgi:hypothetical protein